MEMCLPHPGTNPFTFASGNLKFTDNCSNCNSHPAGMMTCENCGGEGWLYARDVDANGEEVEYAGECPECNGSGWVEGEPPPLSIDDLDMRAPIEMLMEVWRDLAAKGICRGLRERIAWHCDRRVSWQYRVSEC